MGVLDSLLEGFATPGPHETDWHGVMKRGDNVKVSVGKGSGPSASHVRGRIVRFEDDGKHAVVSPEGSGPHVRAKVDQLSFETPAGHARQQAEREKAEQQQAAQMAGKPPGVPAAAGAAAPAAKVRESIGLLFEAFNASAPPPQSETPAQSQARGAQQVKQARAALATAWQASKHPRGVGGTFAYTTGGKRATRSSSSQQRVLNTGASGSLVRSIQKQLGLKQTGSYDASTKLAVERYQRQHGLTIDGVVGRQTLASLRGHSNAAKVKPGPIAAKAATVRVHKAQRRPRAHRMTNRNPWAPAKGQNRIAGGARV